MEASSGDSGSLSCALEGLLLSSLSQPEGSPTGSHCMGMARKPSVVVLGLSAPTSHTGRVSTAASNAWTYGTVGGKLPTLGEGLPSLWASLGQSGLLLLSPLLPPPGEAECLFPPAYGELLTVLVGRTGIFSFKPELRNLALRGITAHLQAPPLKHYHRHQETSQASRNFQTARTAENETEQNHKCVITAPASSLLAATLAPAPAGAVISPVGRLLGSSAGCGKGTGALGGTGD